MSKFSNNRKPTMWWMALLLAAFVGVLWVPFFNQVNPEVLGIPFFFRYQFLWVILSALVTALVYFKPTPQLQPIRRKHPKQRNE